MKRLLFASIFLTSYLSASPSAHIRFWDWSCPRTMIAGSRSFCVTTPRPGFTFTADPSTNRLTADSTYTPVNGDLLTPESSGTLPGGMYTIVDNYWPNYAVCNVSGQTFQLREAADQYTTPNSCSGNLTTVTDAGTGIHTATLYTASNVYLDSDPTGFPPGTTFAYMVPSGSSECNHTAPTLNGKTYAPGQGTICIVAMVPSNATPGTMTTHTRFCASSTGTNCSTFDWVIEVVAPPNVPYTPPNGFTAIPNLAAWEKTMVAQPCPGSQCGSIGNYTTYSGPANFCYPLASPLVHQLGASTSAGVSYYGWNLLFDNMAIYTGNSVYRTGCFAGGMGGPSGPPDLAGVKAYVVANGGSMIGYAHFTESLFRAARVFNDSSYSDAGLLMKNNYIIALGPKLGFGQMRENSYGLDDAVALSKYGNYNAPKWADVRDGLYSLMLRATESDTSGVRFNQQAFLIGGLAPHAIIADWQLTLDPRAPYVIKRAIDFIWSNYDQTNHAWMNLPGPAPTSPWCSNLVLWFTTNGVDSSCGANNLQWQSLQMMAVQAFWWYYAYTGDTTYRDRGDDLFAHAFDQGGLTGKQASEAYYDSFNAVGWRTGTLKANQWYGDAQTLLAGGGQPSSSATCDLNGDGQVNVIDVQLGTNQVLGIAACTNGDLNGDGHCTIVDVMRIVSASLGAACSTAP